MKKAHEFYYLICIVRFSKYPSAEIIENANASIVIKILDNYKQIHGVPRSLRTDQARYLIGKQEKKICTKNIITLITNPANDHRAIGLVEPLVSSIKQRPACIKEAYK